MRHQQVRPLLHTCDSDRDPGIQTARRCAGGPFGWHLAWKRPGSRR